ncbi:(2Fe-2S)-binding protein [Sporosarcina sp. ACRSM]|uniref:(2Fe-2S)-binding protein n=1 Tax=Sporosarcina sp. ACRSM TaxID=2918216 RepID=UPI001EF54CF2|nr:(2Fe-2S)-binding protein [Sporosarcina sp. ACRSM]MCG7333714.1 (2Fe-2S)-binding protein [Sporosarcina sp. ACRSM]
MHINEHPIMNNHFNKDITFTYQGQTFIAREGQTLAAALFANGIKKLGVSRKFHKPRGLFCANGRCTSCFVTVNGLDHVLSCMTLVEEGMVIEANNSDPTVRSGQN